MVSGALVWCLGLWLNAGPPASPPALPWLEQVERTLAPGGKAADGLAVLSVVPEAERETVDYHWALARVQIALDQPARVAEAAATGLLLASRPDGAVRDFTEVRAWLTERGRKSFEAALAAQAQGKLAEACKAYLLAVKCDGGLLARDDKGLRDRAIAALRQTVAKKPEQLDLRFSLGHICYTCGRNEDAALAWQQLVALEKQPYGQWRARTWLAAVQGESAAEKASADAAAAERARQRTSEARAAADAARHDVALPPARRRDPDAAERARIDQQIAQIDYAIARENAIMERKEKAPNGFYYDLGAVKRNLADLEERKRQLEDKRSYLK